MRLFAPVFAIALLCGPAWAEPPFSAPPAPQTVNSSERVLEQPVVAMRRHQSGSVVLNVLVNPAGRVVDVTVATSSGFPQLDAAALLDAQSWHFAFVGKASPGLAWRQITATFPATSGGPPDAPTNFDAVPLVSAPMPDHKWIYPKRDMKSLPTAYYPPLARAKGEHGTVVVEYIIGTDGLVQDDRIVQSSGYALLDAYALISVGTARFMGAAFEDGVPTPMRLLITMKYNLAD